MDDLDDLELPETPTIEGLKKLVGEDALAQLSVDFGGSRLPIPVSCGEHSPLAHSIGQAQATRICKVWGGMYWDVPLNIGVKMRVLRLKADGVSHNRIARILHISLPRVRRIVSEARESGQYSLF